MKDVAIIGAGEVGGLLAHVLARRDTAAEIRLIDESGRAAALRAMIALETDGSPQDIALSIAGVPPSQIVVAWDDATIGGFAAARVLDEPTRRRLAARLPSLWPPGPYALASAAAKVIEAL